ncbi:MAG: tetratricopeptide repeat protein [Acidobacteriota bacterium]|nr:tetratricopeptide repeat protein [Acidobacteriota bacterium]
MYRPKLIAFALAFSLCFGCVAFAQRRGGQTQQTPVEIHVYVKYANEHSAGPQLMVEVITNGGVPLAQGFTDSTGQAVITMLGAGTFRVRVSGIEIESKVSDPVEINDQDRMAVVSVQVEPKPRDQQNAQSSGAGMASASQLNIPGSARKPFEKGMDAMKHKDFPKAADLSQKAIDAYPQFDAAYDNLGVALIQMGQTDKAGAAFQKAVEVNDKNADANRNYSRYLINIKQYAQAEEPLKRALMVAPQDPSSLTLLAIAEFQTKDYDGALQSALKVHQVSHEGYAMAHYIAARVYELKQQGLAATAEYQTYLKESPNGPQAEQARAALARLTANRPPESASQ